MSRKPKKGYFVRGQFVAEGSEMDIQLKAELKGTPDASRTDLKRESDELQDLGKELLSLRTDLFNAVVDGRNAAEVVDDQAWVENEFIPKVAKRGAAIIEARGSSSAASAANATVEHMRDWVLGTPKDDWVSMSVPSDGSYGVPEGIISSFPCTVTDGEYTIVQGLEINEFSRAKIDASVAELVDERDAVTELGLI